MVNRKIVVVRFFLSLACLFCLQLVQSQVSFEGKPLFAGVAKSKALPEIQLKPAKVLQEKAAQHDSRLKALTFAYPIPVSLTPYNTGKWFKTDNGDRVWLAEISSDNAFSLNLIFNKFNPAPGVKVFIYNTNGSFVLGAYTRESNPESTKFATTPVPGDKIYLEMQVAKGITHFGDIEISTVNHDFVNIYRILKDGGYGKSGDCNKDIACYAGEQWDDIKRAVLRILINGNVYCTGTLMNNTAADGTPYVYTANHCISDFDDAQSSIFYFNYESPTCDGIDGSIMQSISSSHIRATTDKLDFTLVELSSRPGSDYSPYYAGWNIDTNSIENVVVIHHPEGDVKKIAFENDSPVTGDFGSGYDKNTHWLVKRWENGTTEPGSSGSPLIDGHNRLLGSLTGGEATCASPENDYFAKIHHAWDDYPASSNQLKYWLDPLAINNSALDGWDPYGVEPEICDTLTNIEATDTLMKSTYINDFGYIAGTNELNLQSYAERYLSNTDSAKVTGVFVNPSKVSGLNKSSILSVQIWSGDSVPKTQLSKKDIFLQTLEENTARNFVSFDSSVYVTDTFFIVVEISQLNETDTFALNYAQNSKGENDVNTAFTFDGYHWIPIQDYSTSLALFPLTCGSIQSNIPSEPLIPSTNLLVYPNPGSDFLNINLNLEKPEPVNLRIVNVSGSIVMQSILEYSVDHQIDISHLDQGFFILHLYTESFFAERKIIISR